MHSADFSTNIAGAAGAAPDKTERMDAQMELDARLRSELERAARAGLDHTRSGLLPVEDAILEVEAAAYVDPVRFAHELHSVFSRVPLMLGASCELPKPGGYKAMEAAGVPILLMRGKDGVARAFLNACTHRGARLAEGCGATARFTCPYHGWSFGLDGKLLAIASREAFGEVESESFKLVELPALEKAGLVWVILDPASRLSIADFLGTFGDMLEGFGFADWHLIDQRRLRGANWKLAFDAHPDWYHLPVLHRDSFGPQVSNRAIYDFYGPHMRMFRPQPEVPPPPETADMYMLDGQVPIGEWPDEALLLGGWLAFPNLSIYTLYSRGQRTVNINQIFPGSDVGESFTVQTLLTEDAPDDDLRDRVLHICDVIEQVVRDEDLPVSCQQQVALNTGLVPKLVYGRNEGGNQHLHRWIEKVARASDAELPGLFAEREAGRA